MSFGILYLIMGKTYGRKKEKPHYVNNKEFLQAMVEWKIDVERQKNRANHNHLLPIILVNVFKDCKPPIIQT